MSLKQGPGTPVKDPVKLELIEDLQNDKPGAKERLYKYLIEDTKRTGTLYTPSYFKSLGIEEPQAYRDTVDEYLKQKAIEYAAQKKIEKAKKIKRLLLIGIIILAIVFAYIFNAFASTYDEAYDEGFEDGENYGYEQGLEAGYGEGHSDGYTEGYETCYDESLDYLQEIEKLQEDNEKKSYQINSLLGIIISYLIYKILERREKWQQKEKKE